MAKDSGKDGGGKGDGGKPPGGRGSRKEETNARPPGLTKNEKLVWDALAEAQEPLKAYEILDSLKEKGVRAPMTIYRALDGLEDKGLIHKLDGLNSFVLCSHEGPHEVQAFLLCDECEGAIEVDIDAIAIGVAPALRRTNFEMHTARLEIKGMCQDCAGKHPHAH
jgi:Fur family zinc uptake transcriptional regulator